MPDRSAKFSRNPTLNSFAKHTTRAVHASHASVVGWLGWGAAQLRTGRRSCHGKVPTCELIAAIHVCTQHRSGNVK
jgi:hypothetical protein